MRIEHWEHHASVRRRLRWLRCLGCALIALPCLGAAGSVGYCVAKWRGNSEAARCVAANAHAPCAERVQALVGMRRDIDMSIAVLRQMTNEQGELGEHARNLIHHLRESMR